MTKLTPDQRRAIDRCGESLVLAAENLWKDTKIDKTKQNDFGHSQMRNLVALALETESPRVVTNFIRYQMGRDRHCTSWRHERLGEHFIRQLEGDDGVVTRALATIPGIETEPELRQLARIELIRNFIGFAGRHLKFVDLKRKGSEEDPNQ